MPHFGECQRSMTVWAKWASLKVFLAAESSGGNQAALELLKDVPRWSKRKEK